jgi:SAM-dependent methyltransferase
VADDRFTADWLSLREPVDHRSRAGHLDAEVAAMGTAQGWRTVVDLGSGSGSNLRYLAPRLPWATRWTLVDHDPGLLERASAPGGIGAEIVRVQGDLAHAGLAAAAEADLVTASALLDLVSRGWLEELVEVVTGSAGALLLALSYDGRVRWEGGRADPDDAWMAEQVNRHQRGQKGMGDALGPEAPALARRLMEDAGWRCTLAPSPWILRGPDDLPLARAWLAGWARAARAVAPDEVARIGAWVARRTEDLAAGRVGVRVGHLDLLALPPGETR